jgi:hypothetical protein
LRPELRDREKRYLGNRRISVWGPQEQVEYRWQALNQGADRRQVNGHEPSGFGESQVSWTQTSCRQERRKPDGKLDRGHIGTGHMDYGLAGRG